MRDLVLAVLKLLVLLPVSCLLRRICEEICCGGWEVDWNGSGSYTDVGFVISHVEPSVSSIRVSKRDRSWGWEMAGTGSQSCQMADWGSKRFQSRVLLPRIYDPPAAVFVAVYQIQVRPNGFSWNGLSSYTINVNSVDRRQRTVFIVRVTKHYCQDQQRRSWTYKRVWYGPGIAVAQWLRCCATNRKVAGSIPDGVIGIFHWHNPSDRTMALGLTQPLTEMSARRISWG